MSDQLTCACGEPKPKGATQCRACAKESFRKFAKWAVLAGVILGLICGQLPEKYQAPCKTLATALSAC